MVPEPLIPEMGGSSPKWALKLEISICPVERQNPF
jgi:hypothetical protein